MINCEIYRNGMCVYIPKNLDSSMGIYEKCICASLKEEDKEELIRKCAKKTLIRKLQQKDRELEIKIK